MKKLDLKGKACPVPVVETKKALEEIDEGIIIVEVDNEVSKNNVERFAKKNGCFVEVEKKNGIYSLTITKGYTCEITEEDSEKNLSDYVLYINKNIMGTGDEELGKILIKAFFKTLIDNDKKPSTIIFVNSGVKLVVKNSELVDILKKLKNDYNVEILVCGTCLDYFNLKENVEVGTISNMFDIQNTIIDAPRVITP